MTQCFCRLCAVFGGFYFLRFPLAGLTIDSFTNQCSGIVSTTGERFRAKDVVICNNAYMESISTNKNVIHRTVLITNTSIKPSEKEDVGRIKFFSKELNYLDYISSSEWSKSIRYSCN
jgi:RAB protein geranylgeranyltransferase component A